MSFENLQQLHILIFPGYVSLLGAAMGLIILAKARTLGGGGPA